MPKRETAGGVPITLRIIIMPRALSKIVCWLCVAVAGMVLAGCAETSYPSLPTLPNIGNLLSPSQQEKAIKDLSSERAQTGETEKPTNR